MISAAIASPLRTFVDRLRARLDADRVDGLEQLVGVLGRVDLLAADLDAERRRGTTLRNATFGLVSSRWTAKPSSAPTRPP